MTRLRSMLSILREQLTSSYWFLPALMALGAIALALSMLRLDGEVKQHQIQRLALVYSGGSDGARAVLSAIATSMMSVAGTVFSISITTLTLASQQFGPRLLTNFMRDRGNQVTLGTFLATFLYCLMVLRTVTGQNQGMVPHLAVTMAVGLALASCGVLVFFIHHVATSIRANSLIATVAADLAAGAERLFPARVGQPQGRGESVFPEQFEKAAIAVRTETDGYLQRIDSESLLALVTKHDLLLRIDVHPGDYQMRCDPILLVSPAERMTAGLRKDLLKSFRFGSERSHAQDLGASITQLVEIAVRSLSSNQVPQTAEQCLDRLGSGLATLADRRLPSPARYDQHGTLRILVRPYSYDSILNTCFDPIRQNGAANTRIMLHLLCVITRVVPRASDPALLQSLWRQADLTREAALQHASPATNQRERIQEQFRIFTTEWEFARRNEPAQS